MSVHNGSLKPAKRSAGVRGWTASCTCGWRAADADYDHASDVLTDHITRSRSEDKRSRIEDVSDHR